MRCTIVGPAVLAHGRCAAEVEEGVGRNAYERLFHWRAAPQLGSTCYFDRSGLHSPGNENSLTSNSRAELSFVTDRAAS